MLTYKSTLIYNTSINVKSRDSSFLNDHLFRMKVRSDLSNVLDRNEKNWLEFLLEMLNLNNIYLNINISF